MSARKSGKRTPAAKADDLGELGVLFEGLRDFAFSLPEFEDSAHMQLFLTLLANRGLAIIEENEKGARVIPTGAA